jgi:hypothetical protein
MTADASDGFTPHRFTFPTNDREERSRERHSHRERR